jgi:AsmA protein
VRVVKWISWGLAGLIVLILLGLAVLVWVVDPNGFKPRIEATVREATGREFTLAGDIELGFFPWISLRTGEGRFGNPAGFPAEPLASWRSARLGARLYPLLRGELVVDRVRLEGADIRLFRRADGKGNWEGIGEDPATTEPADPHARSRYITIDGVDIRDSRLLFVDEAAAQRVEIVSLNLTTDAIAPDRPFTDTEVSGVLHMPGFAPAGVPFSVEVPEAALTRDYSNLSMPGFELSLGSLEVAGAVSGELAEPMRLSGNLGSNTFDARALLASLGFEAPRTTDPSSLTRIAFDASWTFDAGALALDPLTLTLDETRLTGNFRRGAGDDPLGEFTLRGDRLDIARYLPPEDPASEPFVLPAAMLKALKFRGVLEIDEASPPAARS